MYARGIKRGIDVCLALIILVIGFIPMIFVSVLIKLDSPGPVLFKTETYWKRWKGFYYIEIQEVCVKGLSIQEAVFIPEKEIQGLPVSEKYLRATSIDELPQAINILIGDMSFVGPRPASYVSSMAN